MWWMNHEWRINNDHYWDVIMDTVAFQITSLAFVYSTVYSDADQIKHQCSASLAFVPRIHRGPGKSPHKWLVTRKMFPFDDVIMWSLNLHVGYYSGPRYFRQLRSRLSFHIVRHKLPIWGRCNQTNKLFGHSMFNLSWTLLSVNGVPIFSFTGFRQHTHQQYNGDPRRTPPIAVTALPLGLYSLSGKTSYCKISWSLEADRLDVIIIVSFWNLTGTSEGALPVKFKSDLKWTKKPILAASRQHKIL